MDNISPGEIVYANVTIQDEKEKIHELRKVVFSRNWECQYPILTRSEYSRFLNQNNFKSDVKLIDLHVITRTGFKHKDQGSTRAKKNEQVRDETTGAYV